MAKLRMDHISAIVEDLDEAVAFFSELGLELEGRMEVSGEVVDQTTGLDGARSEIAMMAAPDGSGKVELTQFAHPVATTAEPDAPTNTIGWRTVMFEFDDIQATIGGLAALGYGLVGEVARFEDVYLLTYVRGPSGIIVALAESLR